MIEKEIALDALSDDLRRVLDYWRTGGGEELRCGWNDFHLDHLPPRLLPTTLVVDVMDDPAMNTFRFWGSGMAFIHGADMTGKTTGSLQPPEFAKAVQDHHAGIAANPVASATLYGFERHGRFEHTQNVLRLPLSDDGRSVSHIVVVIELTSTVREKLARRDTKGSF